ncbi:HpcH/HpaI aldolase/citrate lyase family protein [Leptospira inadai serovar Lyme str. 10]|uniref:HpcH/HpaI aldolase/citrate lyase family protein n=2 Tax=Leptospira inadai serovar Lyme TaxID=293084 RepID=V6HAR7_9LEPT|nr:aldolase/citrate lyase family protein [Leptospira inadai]EQA36576.1 HpcH/HpaI aldolase/citrate lyase family protein [Leptospira inadai serovar Lyme str. 10]PNV75842.1 2,4-dihydroxyhept-2-ene-1,7-dioic acid aldolase [Leptospira inadai serovar Lyme]
MNKLEAVQRIRKTLNEGGNSIGSWMQIPHSSIAEIIGQGGYDWVAIDLEHGSIGVQQLPDLFRALELGNTLPLVRISHGAAKDCKQALDAGAGGIIVPMIESAAQLARIRDACCWPPTGTRGVGFSRANLFGKNFSEYSIQAQSPLLIAMIENIHAVDRLLDIVKVKGLDAILIGPYDLSASMGMIAKFDDPSFLKIMDQILRICGEYKIACGVHVVAPEPTELFKRMQEGYRFLAYSIDAVFLTNSVNKPGMVK